MSGLKQLNERFIRSRIHIHDHNEFVNKIILDRDHSAYPDPFMREVEDRSLLELYLKRIIKAIRYYDADNESEINSISEFYDREQERINHHIGRLKYPDPCEFDISLNFIQKIKNVDLQTGYTSVRGIDWDVLDELYNLQINKLRYLSGYFLLNKNVTDCRIIDRKVRIINSIRYIKADPTIDIENFIRFVPLSEIKDELTIKVNDEPVNLEKGVQKSRIKEEIDRLFDIVDGSLKLALALANISEITNYYNPKLNCGSYDSFTINFGKIIKNEDETCEFSRNIFAHEIYHSLQDITGSKDMINSSENVSLDKTPDEWDKVVLPEVDREDLSEINDNMIIEWFKFRQNTDYLCEYQTKNMSELYAVAFEAYVEDRELLKEEQPQIYELIEESIK